MTHVAVLVRCGEPDSLAALRFAARELEDGRWILHAPLAAPVAPGVVAPLELAQPLPAGVGLERASLDPRVDLALAKDHCDCTDVAGLRAELRAAIEGRPRELRAPSELFFELELEFNACGLATQDQLDPAERRARTALAERVSLALTRRVLQRARGEAVGGGEGAVERADLLSLSGPQLRLFARWAGQDGELDPRRFERALELFVNGELAYPSPCTTWNLQPNGGYYCAFAEFALAAIAAEVDAPSWSALLPALARTQAVLFERTAHPDPALRRFRDYSWKHARPARAWSSRRLRELEVDWSGLALAEIEARMGRQARSALAGER